MKINAQDYIAGYCVINDVSVKELFRLKRMGQWTKGKSHAILLDLLDHILLQKMKYQTLII